MGTPTPTPTRIQTLFRTQSNQRGHFSRNQGLFRTIIGPLTSRALSSQPSVASPPQRRRHTAHSIPTPPPPTLTPSGLRATATGCSLPFSAPTLLAGESSSSPPSLRSKSSRLALRLPHQLGALPCRRILTPERISLGRFARS